VLRHRTEARDGVTTNRLDKLMIRHTPKMQSGMTGLGWLTVIALVLFFALLIVKLVPTYLENYSIKVVLHSLEEEPLITQKSLKQVRELINKRLTINGVYDMDKSSIKIKKESGVLSVDIAYEVRKHMFGNIDVVMSFSDAVEMVSH
jgi:hypothetical protein